MKSYVMEYLNAKGGREQRIINADTLKQAREMARKIAIISKYREACVTHTW